MKRKSRAHGEGLQLPFRELPNGCFVARMYGHEVGVCRGDAGWFFRNVRRVDGKETAEGAKFRRAKQAGVAALDAARRAQAARR